MAPYYLALSLLAGFFLVQRLCPTAGMLVRLSGAFGVSVVVTGWVAFWAAWAAHGLGSSDATYRGVEVATAVNVLIVGWGCRCARPANLRVSRVDAVLGAGSLALSAWIMHARLSGSPLTVGANVWGDTALHMGIARSFSEGDNFPPQLPIFSGESIRYHFGFDFYAGSLERAGLPIDWAFNLPGALGFTAILLLVIEFARHLWRSTTVGVIAAGLFATDSSMAFLRYLSKEGSLSKALSPSTLWHHVGYDGGGPYNGDKISIFMTLNPYLTQTHLIVALAVVLFVGLLVLQSLRGTGSAEWQPDARAPAPAVPLPRARSIALGALLGASFWLNGIVVIVATAFFVALYYVFGGRARATARVMTCVAAVAVPVYAIGADRDSNPARYAGFLAVVAALALCGPLSRSLPFLLSAGVLALPQLVWLNGGPGTNGSMTFHTGYLVENFDAARPRSWWDFTQYWWLNIGLTLPLLVLAALWCRREDRKLLLAIMSIFAIGNLIAFGRELGGHNHKVFNLWEILVNLLAAYALVRLLAWMWGGLAGVRTTVPRTAARVLAGATAVVAAVLLSASGVLDYLTLKNDARYEVFGGTSAAISWIEQNTRPDAVFLTAYGQVYTTPTFAGRRVYLGGFEPWTVIMGYASKPREEQIAAFYGAPDGATACARLAAMPVDYIEVSGAELHDSSMPANPSLFPGRFRSVYSDGSFTFYDAHSGCDGTR